MWITSALTEYLAHARFLAKCLRLFRRESRRDDKGLSLVAWDFKGTPSPQLTWYQMALVG